MCFLSSSLSFLPWLTIRQIDNSHVTRALKLLMKNVQTNEDLDVSENELENLVRFYISYRISHPSNVLLFDQLVKAKEQQEKEYVENIKTKKSAKAKVCHSISFFAGSIIYKSKLVVVFFRI